MKNDATQVTLSRWTSEAMTAPTLHAQVLALRHRKSVHMTTTLTLRFLSP